MTKKCVIDKLLKMGFNEVIPNIRWESPDHKIKVFLNICKNTSSYSHKGMDLKCYINNRLRMQAWYKYSNGIDMIKKQIQHYIDP